VLIKINDQIQCDVSVLINWIKENMGVLYNERNIFALEKRLRNFVDTHSIKTEAELMSFLNTHNVNNEQDLYDLFVNNETFFYREPKFFESLKNEIIPYFVNECKKDHITVWTMACSTGQEAYTTAMIMEELCHSGSKFTYEIRATDISHRAIEQAKSGEYDHLEINRGLTPDQIEKFTYRKGDKFCINNNIKNHMTFEKKNLIRPWMVEQQYDLLICRNLLYYFDDVARSHVVKNAFNTLNNDGLFCLSGSENLFDYQSFFRHAKFYASFNKVTKR